MAIEIRKLKTDDAEAFLAIRLRALTDHPEAFLVSADEEMPVEGHRERLAKTEGKSDDGIFGAFEDGAIVGVTGLYRPTPHRAKGRHRAMIWGVYVAPEARSKGVGRQLMEAAIEAARQADGIEVLGLGVRAYASAARALYASVGFETWGIEKHSIKLGDEYIDEEMMDLFL